MTGRNNLSVSGLLERYRHGEFSPREFLTRQLKLVQRFDTNPAWIACLSHEQLEPYLQRLDSSSAGNLPLYGVPFAIKDNIDLAGLPTTAACPAFAYTAEQSASAVQRLIEAGAVPMGKTNMDQFATGLVGTRSPYGVCHSVFSSDHISGGSSSGSAVAVAEGLVAFSLGTDTAGSGRVPAAFNNIVGLKPTRGLLSNTGIVRACRSLDCISIFALTAGDARLVFEQARGPDSSDEYSRDMHTAPMSVRPNPRVAIPLDNRLEHFGDRDAIVAHRQALGRLAAAGWELVATDFSPFFEAARLLYQGPWVAERQAAFGEFAAKNPEAVLPLLHQILSPGDRFSAAEVFEFQYRLQQLKAQADRILANYDFALTPTVPSHYRIDQVSADPISLNSNLGTYTNFMNLLDLSAVAVPAGFTDSDLPWGVTLFAPAFHDYRLLAYADQVQRILPMPLGKSGQAALNQVDEIPARSDRLALAVCGAHMSGLPLNHQLLDRDGILTEKTTTATGYRLFALEGGPPQRPGLLRDEDAPTRIDVEVWSLPMASFGSLLESIPPPLGLGKIQLADGRWVSSFICEPWGIQTGKDISSLGSWRNFVQQKNCR
jgi:allophanate hydrolase